MYKYINMDKGERVDLMKHNVIYLKIILLNIYTICSTYYGIIICPFVHSALTSLAIL